MTWELARDTVGRDFFAAHTVSELAAWTDYDLENAGRLAEPMCYDAASDKYVPITWEDAFELAGAALRGLASPDEAAFYTSGRLSNEATFLYQLWAREFGTNNLPDCSNMCHEASGRALTAAIGSGIADYSTQSGQPVTKHLAVEIIRGRKDASAPTRNVQRGGVS